MRRVRRAAAERGRGAPNRRGTAPTVSGGHLTTSLAGVHAFLVDDEPDSLDVVETVLRYCGAVVTTAATAKEAVARLGELTPTIIVTDISMPGEDGFWLMQRVRELPRCTAVPVVALTAHVGLDDRMEQAGFASYIVKPVDPWALCVELQRPVQRRHTGLSERAGCAGGADLCIDAITSSLRPDGGTRSPWRSARACAERF